MVEVLPCPTRSMGAGECRRPCGALVFVTKIDQDLVELEIKEKLDRSASKLDRPTSEMPGMHQPSAFSTKLFVSKSIAGISDFCGITCAD